jgi:hypothetical protein
MELVDRSVSSAHRFCVVLNSVMWQQYCAAQRVARSRQEVRWWLVPSMETSIGTSVLHRSTRSGQRGWNAHPDGTASALAGSPGNRTGSAPVRGTEANSALV